MFHYVTLLLTRYTMLHHVTAMYYTGTAAQIHNVVCVFFSIAALGLSSGFVNEIVCYRKNNIFGYLWMGFVFIVLEYQIQSVLWMVCILCTTCIIFFYITQDSSEA